MSATRKPRVPMSEQIKLINECRKSGLTDADWCRDHQIAPSTFYNWISRCRKAACADQIAEPRYGHSDLPRAKQDVVPVTVISDVHADYRPDPNRLPVAEQHLDNSHTIEVVWNDITIRLTNQANPVLVEQMLRTFREALC